MFSVFLPLSAEEVEYSFEDIDSTYTGVVKITPRVEKKYYDLNLYYEVEDDGIMIYDSHTVKRAYSMDTSCDLTDKSNSNTKPPADPEGKVFDGGVVGLVDGDVHGGSFL